MYKKLKTAFAVLCTLLLLSSCGNSTSAANGSETSGTGTSASEGTDTSSETTVETVSADSTSSYTNADMFTDRDKEVGYDSEECIQIRLNGTSAECTSDSVQINQQTMTISDEGDYLVSGTLTDGMLIIDAEDTDKIHLILDNVSIANSTSAAIYVRNADKVFITLAPESENTLSNGGTYTAIDDNNIDAVIFSKSDLTINGSGSLTISAGAGHGIVSKDDLVITGGTYIITAEKHGLSGKDSLRIADGNFTITSGKDGCHADHDEDTSKGFIYIAGGTFNITADDDGMSASGALTIDGGTINIVRCYEGLEGQTVDITNGQITICSDDDGVNAASGNTQESTSARGFGFGGDTDPNTSIRVSGGTLYITAEGDGIDSNGSLSISGGEVYISGPENGGNGSLDYGTEATITGGIFAAAGSSQMAQSFSDSSTQGSILLTVGTQNAGSSITLTDESGQEIFSWQPDKQYDCVIISCPEITQGAVYTLSAGTSRTSITMDTLQYTSGGTMNGMPGTRNNMPGDRNGMPGNKGNMSEDTNGMPGGMKDHMDKENGSDDMRGPMDKNTSPEDMPDPADMPDEPGADNMPDNIEL